MSHVTNLIVATAVGEKGIPHINEYSMGAVVFNLVDCDTDKLPRGWYGGTKMLECQLLIGAINYLDLNDFISYMRTIQFDFPESVQVIVKEEDDLKFRIIDIWE